MSEPTEKQIRKLKQLAKKITDDASFRKTFSHIKNPESLEKMREWIKPYCAWMNAT